jgi:hypothetical protein
VILRSSSATLALIAQALLSYVLQIVVNASLRSSLMTSSMAGTKLSKEFGSEETLREHLSNDGPGVSWIPDKRRGHGLLRHERS